MAFALLDGTSGQVDLTIQIPGGTVGTSYKCAVGAIRGVLRRDMTSTKTFCTAAGWEARSPQNKQMFIRASKFLSSGSIISDPGILFSTNTPNALTWTAATGCTFTGNFIATEDNFAQEAGVTNSPGELVLESNGAVATTWVIA